MENIIFLTLDLVYPDDTGGRKLSLGRILYEQERGNRVTVIHYNLKNQVEDEAVLFFKERDIPFYSFNKNKKQSICSRLFGYLKSFINKIPEPSYLINKDKDFNYFLDDKIKEIKPTLVSIESIFLVGVGSLLQSRMVNRNYTFHNVESSFYYSLFVSDKKIIKKIHYLIQSYLLKTVEKDIFNSTGDVTFTFLSKNDMSEYQKKYIINSDRCLINHNHLNVTQKIERNINHVEPFYLFAGSLDFPANSYAIRKLLDTPGVNWDFLPKIIITGTVSDSTRKMFSGYKNINLVGRVNDNELNELFATCLASISPILTGGGIKIKNLEALKLGVPLIATDFSCIGIDVKSESVILTENDPASFYKAMVDYYKNNG
ncbi:glycosyltransferase [Kluyvera sp. EC_51]|uniref:glycosyltransferase n=1 Tax=Kluyvera sp. EC_51 TaxID=2584089 RepID=UPI001C702928|nr:glycosyltransferase [Kluyvera sp. EC_51]